jgi:hypothetical protein
MSAVQICNSALIKLGARTIGSLSEDKKEAKLCNEQYAKLRDEVLRSYPWNFAIRRAKLTKLLTDPVWGYSNQFQLPADYVRIIKPEDATMDFRIEADKLLTNDSSVNILYVGREENTALFDPMFKEALALRIASELAYPLVQSTALQQAMLEAYKIVLQDTRSADAQESGDNTIFVNDYFITSRY